MSRSFMGAKWDPAATRRTAACAAAVIAVVALAGCHKTMIRTGAATERVAEARQWFLFDGLIRVSRSAGGECDNGLSFSESKYGVSDFFLSAGIGALAVLAYSQTLSADQELVPERAASLVTLVSGLISSRSVRYGCAAAAAPKYRRHTGDGRPTRQVPAAPTTARVVTRDAGHNRCPGTKACSQLGRCSLFEGRCVALSDTDCSESVTCRKLGRCRAEGGSCVSGVASPTPTQSVAHGSDSCMGEEACTKFGLCRRLQGKCVAADSESCRSAAVCRQSGKCVAVGGKCVAASGQSGPKTSPPAHSCVGSKQCRDEGLCLSLQGECVAGKESDCKAAAVCRILGKCRARRGKCIE